MSQDSSDNLPDLPDDLPAPLPDGEESAVPSFKVELDIDDAPFLEEEEEEEAPAPAPEPVKEVKKTAEIKEKPPSLIKRILARLRSDKKLLILVIAGFVLLLSIPLALVLFFSGAEDAPPPPPPPVEQPAHAPEPPAPPDPVDIFIPMEPFFVERRGSEGEIRFLRCAFTIVTREPNIQTELMMKNTVVRDAVYYYLSNKTFSLSREADSPATLKEELLSVINEHISSGKIDVLLIEDYFIMK